MSSQIGNSLKVSLFGESHGAAVGAVIDGFPPGVKIDRDELLSFMKRRAPGRDKTSTPRKESDLPQILSGILEDVTCGTPIAAVIENTNTRSGDYRKMSSAARPGHADYTGYVRYKGNNDVRGGGHFSARLTAPLVFAGGLCLQYLKRRGIFIGAHLKSVKNEKDADFPETELLPELLLAPGKKAFPVVDDEAEGRMRAVIEEARVQGDSVGGIVEVAAVGMPAGIGSPIFDSVEGRLSYGYFGIPAVKGVEFGAGFRAAELFGSENNDAFYIDENVSDHAGAVSRVATAGESSEISTADGTALEDGARQRDAVQKGAVKTRTNRHGGILGGISSGMPIIARLAFKPTPSISKRQETIDFIRGENVQLSVEGRHDPCVAVRAVPVVEAVTAIVLMDLLLEQEGVR